MVFSSGAYSQDPLQDAFYSGEYEEVIRITAESIATGDSSYNNYYLQSLSLVQLGKINAAVTTLEEAVRIFPEEPSLLKLLASQYDEAGAYLKAQQLYEQMIQGDSTDLHARIKLAEISNTRQHYQTAIDHLHQVLLLDSSNLSGLMLMGDILTRQDNSAATVYYKRAFQYYPENQQAAYALANWDIQLNMPQMAVVICEEILAKDSTNIRFRKLMGFAYYRSRNPRHAIEQLTLASAMGDSTAFTFKYLGLSHYMISDFAGAIAPLEFSLKKDTTDADLHFFLGASLATTTRKPEAMFHLDKALQMMQPDPSAVARIYSEQGNLKRLEMEYEEAYELYRLSWEADTTNPMSLYYMASILDNSLHRSSDALVDYQRFLDALEQLPDESENNNQIPTIKQIVEDRIILLREELFFLDEQ